MHLIFDKNASYVCFLKRSDRALDIGNAAIPCFGISQYRYTDSTSHISGVCHHLSHGQQPNVRLPEARRRSAKSSNKDRFETSLFYCLGAGPILCTYKNKQFFFSHSL